MSLRPFFGYYGGKWRHASLYPSPLHPTVVEPFAGSAGYSLRYPERSVVLCERDPVLVAVWQYLIAVKPGEIRRIPDIPPDGSVDDVPGPQEAKWLVGLWLNRGTTGPRKRPSKWMREGIRPGSFWGQRVRNTIAEQVGRIRHWQIHHCSYEQCPVATQATWFIDPPYEKAGRYYKFGPQHIDYDSLALWCLGRRGQTIVCENQGATWLPFESLAAVKTTRPQRRSKEAWWYRPQSLNGSSRTAPPCSSKIHPPSRRAPQDSLPPRTGAHFNVDGCHDQGHHVR